MTPGYGYSNNTYGKSTRFMCQRNAFGRDNTAGPETAAKLVNVFPITTTCHHYWLQYNTPLAAHRPPTLDSLFYPKGAP